jgi:ankyrin repeat protein
MRYWLLLWLLAAAPLQAALSDDLCQLDTDLSSALAEAPPETLAPALMALFRCPLAADDSRAMTRVRQLLDAGADPAFADPTGNSPLHAALEHIAAPSTGAVHFYRDAARLLLARGADPLALRDDGMTPLQLAAREANGQVSQLLLDLGADPTAAAQDTRSALEIAATSTDNLDTFALLLRTAESDTPLAEDTLAQLATLAAARHDHGKLNLLLQRQPTLTIERTDATASLARALWQGAPLEVARRLASAGADPVALPTMGGGDLAWRLATLGREAELDWLLEQGYPLNQLPQSGIPPLFYADTDATRLLLARGADPALPSATLGPTAAALTPPQAPFNEGGTIIRPDKLALLLEAGYPPDLKDPQGRTALEHAVRADAHWLSRALLRAGASPLPSSDGNASLLPLAVTHTRVTTLQLLLRRIEDATSRHPGLLLDALAGDSIDPLVVEALLVAGFDTEQRNARGETPLLLAARQQQWPLVSMLLRYGADPQSVNSAGCTLQCYEWSMPDPVYRQLAPLLGHEPARWQPPTVDQRPAGFFALSLVPLLAAWLLLSGWRLARHEPLAGPGSWMLAGAVSGTLTGGALFYQCQPCVLTDPWGQMTITGTVALLVFGLLAWRQTRQASNAAAPARAETGAGDSADDATPAPAPPAEPADEDWPTLPDDRDPPRGFW